MGACCSMQPDDNTKQIDNILHREQQDEKAVIKLLFLGPGGSGKSTIFKQLQFLHGNGFTESDARFLREVIYTQIISQMQCIIKYYKLQDDESNDEPLQNAISTVLKHDEMRSFNTELADSVQYIWTHAEQITHAFSDTEVAKTQMLDETTEYFWNDLDRIKDANYFPKEKDIIYVRFRTTGMRTCTDFSMRVRGKPFPLGCLCICVSVSDIGFKSDLASKMNVLKYLTSVDRNLNAKSGSHVSMKSMPWFSSFLWHVIMRLCTKINIRMPWRMQCNCLRKQ
eukprot:931165_1